MRSEDVVQGIGTIERALQEPITSQDLRNNLIQLHGTLLREQDMLKARRENMARHNVRRRDYNTSPLGEY